MPFVYIVFKHACSDQRPENYEETKVFDPNKTLSTCFLWYQARGFWMAFDGESGFPHLGKALVLEAHLGQLHAPRLGF